MSPATRSAVLSRTMESGVALARQSRPQRDQRTGRLPLRRTPSSEARLNTPNGGRYAFVGVPAASSTVAIARRRSSASACGERRRWRRWRLPCSSTWWPAATISAASDAFRSTCSPTRKNVAVTPIRPSCSSTAGVPLASGPSSKVSATPRRPSSSRLGMRSARATSGAMGAAAGTLHAATAPTAPTAATIRTRTRASSHP